MNEGERGGKPGDTRNRLMISFEVSRVIVGSWVGSWFGSIC
jgi:hypothetical protein